MSRAIGLVLFASILVGAAVAVAVIRPETFWTPDGADVARSLDRVGDDFIVDVPCRRVSEQSWSCDVEEDPGSGVSGTYRVIVRPDDCWTARRAARNPQAWAPLAGCIGFTDFAGL